MKRLLLVLLLTFGLTYPASGDYDPNSPLGRVSSCVILSQIMVNSRLTLLNLTDEAYEVTYNLRKGSDADSGLAFERLVFGGVKPPTSGSGDYFINLEKLVRSMTHAHEMARDAYESACMENNK